MSEFTRGIGRVLTRLLEAYAPTVGTTMIVHQTFYGCHVIDLSALPASPPAVEPTPTAVDTQPPQELRWHRSDGQWQLDGQVLPALPAGSAASSEIRPAPGPEGHRREPSVDRAPADRGISAGSVDGTPV